MEPAELSVVETVHRIQSGLVGARETVEAFLARIEARENAVQAWARVDEYGARRQADFIDGLSELEKAALPLCGVPVGIKDIIATAGVATTAGSRILHDWVPDRDADVVRRLRAAGAVILGKTATTEFAGGDPAPTRNPWAVNHTPGGSSAGSAAALAADMCAATIGTQTAGSIVRPSAYCGVVGLKPTYGAVSRDGVLPLAWSLDHAGPMARSVEDVAVVYDQIVGAEPVPTTGRPTVGIPDRYFDSASVVQAAALESTIGLIQALGWRVVEVALPRSFEAMVAAAEVVLPVETAAAHQRWFAEAADDYGPRLRDLIESADQVSGTDYVNAQRVRRRGAQEFAAVFDEIDILLTPSAPDVAPDSVLWTGDPRFNLPFASLGVPSVTVPVPDPNGGALPASVQLIGMWGTDRWLLSGAAEVECAVSATGWNLTHRRARIDAVLSTSAAK
ncbi:amidase [Nocardia pseudovaccinii]|uniref:amidase n=1 Tax=Nocardia pseudovaccinii TaxID=189540 RepID=UPI003D8CAC00